MMCPRIPPAKAAACIMIWYGLKQIKNNIMKKIYIRTFGCTLARNLQADCTISGRAKWLRYLTDPTGVMNLEHTVTECK